LPISGEQRSMTGKRSLSGSKPETPQPVADGGGVDLACLRDMHPRLPPDMAAVMVTRAALGLQRNKHSSGTALEIDIEAVVLCFILRWPDADPSTAKQHDFNRITEDGAEAIALAVAHKTKSWRVVRRMQREEYADWLLEHQESGARRLVALEVSGVDRGSIAARLKDELAQVAKSTDVDQRWAGVVGFQKPKAALQSLEVRTDDR